MPKSYSARSREEIERHAGRLLLAIAYLSVGSVQVHLTHVLAIGGNGITYRGHLDSGRLVVAKVPTAFVGQSAAILDGGEVLGFTDMIETLRREAEWFDRLQPLHLFPRKLFPPAQAVPVATALRSEILLPMLLLEYFGEPTLREVLGSIGSSFRLRRILAEPGPSQHALILGEILVGLLRGLAAILNTGGIYTDLAPDNFIVGRVARPVVFLDAGGIVRVEAVTPFPIQLKYVPIALQRSAKRLLSLGDAGVQAVLLGMVAKLTASLLIGMSEGQVRDPSPTNVASRVPGAWWLEEFLSRAMLHERAPFKGLLDAAAFVESHVQRWRGGWMGLRRTSVGHVN